MCLHALPSLPEKGGTRSRLDWYRDTETEESGAIMATTLRMVVDQMITPVPNGISRYTEEMTRALVQTAPRGCTGSTRLTLCT